MAFADGRSTGRAEQVLERALDDHGCILTRQHAVIAGTEAIGDPVDDRVSPARKNNEAVLVRLRRRGFFASENASISISSISMCRSAVLQRSLPLGDPVGAVLRHFLDVVFDQLDFADRFQTRPGDVVANRPAADFRDQLLLNGLREQPVDEHFAVIRMGRAFTSATPSATVDEPSAG